MKINEENNCFDWNVCLADFEVGTGENFLIEIEKIVRSYFRRYRSRQESYEFKISLDDIVQETYLMLVEKRIWKAWLTMRLDDHALEIRIKRWCKCRVIDFLRRQKTYSSKRKSLDEDKYTGQTNLQSSSSVKNFNEQEEILAGRHINKVVKEILDDLCDQQLNELEKKILFNYRPLGFGDLSDTNLANALGIPRKKIENTASKIKRQFKKICEKKNIYIELLEILMDLEKENKITVKKEFKDNYGSLQ